MNWIIRKWVKLTIHTYLDEVFEPLKDEINNYNWILCDLEYGGWPNEDLPINMDTDYFVFSPKEFKNLLKKRVQIYWGVIIGVPKSIAIKLDHDNLPYVEGNGLIWKNGNLQHFDAEIEIICVDSGYTIAKFTKENLSKKFKDYFEEAVELEKFK